MSATSTLPASDRLERLDQPLSTALAEYQAAVLERDRLRSLTREEWTSAHRTRETAGGDSFHSVQAPSLGAARAVARDI